MLAVTSGGVFVAFLDVSIVNVAFPSLQHTFATTPLADLSWILNAYNVAFAALLVPFGRLGDLLGRKRLFLSALALFGAASLVCAVAPGVWWLVAARVLQAAAGAALIPCSLGLLLPAFPPERRAVAISIWGATGAFSAALGPSLGGVLVNAFGWRSIFFVNIPITAAFVIAGRRVLTEIRDPAAGHLPDPLGIVALAGGVGVLALGVVRGPDWGWASSRTLLTFAGSVALLVFFTLRSARHPRPVFELSLFQSRSFSAASGVNFLFGATFYAVLLANVLFLTKVWGYSTLATGFAITPAPLMAAIGSPFAGRLVGRFGPRAVAVPAIGLVVLASTALATLPASASYGTRFLLPGLLMGLGVSATFGALSTSAVRDLPPLRYSTGGAIALCFRQVGGAIGISILIALLTSQQGATQPLHTFHLAYAVLAGIALAAVIGALLLPTTAVRPAT